MDYLTRAIQSLRPNSEFSFQNKDYSTIKWDILEGTAPTGKAIDDEIARLKAADLTIEADRAAAKTALLARLGITADEAALLLG
jgi:hypothetical protein